MKSEFVTLSTQCVHAGREDLAALGVHVPPIDLSITYPTHDPAVAEQSYDELAAGAPAATESVYARLHNPTVARYERAIAALEHADDAVAFASGMAALSACLLAVRETHSHVVGGRPLYAGTDHILEGGRLGLDVTWAPADRVATAIRPDTGLIICETPQNPTLGQLDISALAAAAGEVPLLVDNTFATLVLQQPLDHGAAIVLHSATKALGGHGDVVGGVVAGSDHWMRRIRAVRAITGAILHPFGAYFLHRSLQTLEVRVLRAQATAQGLVRRLVEHPGVARLRYPCLPSDPGGALLGKQLRGPGSIIAFDAIGGRDAARAILRSLELITPAVSLGGADSLIQMPASLTHRIVAPEIRKDLGIDGETLRLSIGLEDADDLWSDLSSALSDPRRCTWDDRRTPDRVIPV